MSTGGDGDLAQQEAGELCVATPQGRHQRTATLRQDGDGNGGDDLPALTAVRSSLAEGDSQHSVQQQDALLEPGAQVATRGGWGTEVGVRFLIGTL